MKELPHVYGMNHGKTQWACQFYRMHTPLSQFSKRGLAVTWTDTLEHGLDETVAAMCTADFDLFWGNYGSEFYSQLQTVKNIKPSKDKDGNLHIPPVLIYDVDDNRDYIHPHNTTFCTQGVRSYPSGKLLEPGTKLWCIDPETEEEVVKWEDLQTYYGGSLFNIERNLHDMAVAHKIFRLVDGMTCASPHLKKYLENVVGVKYVHFFPNTIVKEDYEEFPLVRTDDKVRILWQGGSSHIVDWYPLRFAMKEVCEKYNNIKIVIFGQLDPWMTKYIPPEKFEHHSWVDYAAYKLRRGLFQVDINLCPLADNAFNRCKSAIKWYEGSIWNEPEATLAANCPPYSDEMTDNVTGLLYKSPEDFAFKLSLLIENADMRKRLAAEAKNWVLTHRVPDVTIPPLWEFYQMLHQKKIGEIIAQR